MFESVKVETGGKKRRETAEGGILTLLGIQTTREQKSSLSKTLNKILLHELSGVKGGIRDTLLSFGKRTPQNVEAKHAYFEKMSPDTGGKSCVLLPLTRSI